MRCPHCESTATTERRERTKRVCELLWYASGVAPLTGRQTLWKEYLSHAAFFSWVSRKFMATITARVCSCEEAVVG